MLPRWERSLGRAVGFGLRVLANGCGGGIWTPSFGSWWEFAQLETISTRLEWTLLGVGSQPTAAWWQNRLLRHASKATDKIGFIVVLCWGGGGGGVIFRCHVMTPKSLISCRS